MGIRELKRLIDNAIDECQRIIEANPKAVLSEGDFERIMANCISEQIGYVPGELVHDAYAVYTQISHYDNETDAINARVDILIMKPDKIIESGDINKGFFYKSKDSIAIELKYRHDDNRGCVTEATKDIDKFVKYKDDSHYYAIILLDKNDNTTDHKRKTLTYFKEKKSELGRKYANKFFCKVLLKDKTHFCRN